MHITFVDNLFLSRENQGFQFEMQPHLGLISLIAMVERAGHQASLYDPKLDITQGVLSIDSTLYKGIAERILATNPDVVGLTTLGCNFICTLKIARYIKATNPDLPILLGGPHATVLHQEILETFPVFLLIAKHEAEQTIGPILEGLQVNDLSWVPGITYRKGGQIIINEGHSIIENVDQVPPAAYHHFPVKDLEVASIRVEAGRGCPFGCTFCSTATFFGRKYRLKSAARLRSDLDLLHEQYGVTDFRLTHDLFTVNRHKIIEFCEEIKPCQYTWRCSARMDCVDQELLSIMAEAGCRDIYYGVETGSQRMQKVSCKKLDLRLFDPILDATAAFGIRSTISFITGYPEETEQDQNETLDMIGSCFFRPLDKAPDQIQLHLLTPEPGTQLMNQYGDEMEYDAHISDFNFPPLEPDDSDIMAQYPKIFMNHHYYRSVIPRDRHVFVTSQYEILYRLDNDLLAHLLTHFDKKLSLFFTRFYNWKEEVKPSSEGEQLLFDFLVTFFDEDHYLISLVKYRLAVYQLNLRLKKDYVQDKTRTRKTTSDEESLFSLSPRALILSDIHDSVEMLDQLAAHVPGYPIRFSSALLETRSNYLLFITQEDEMPYVRNFLLDDNSKSFIQSFITTGENQQEEASPQLNSENEHQELFQELLTIGVLESAKSF